MLSVEEVIGEGIVGDLCGRVDQSSISRPIEINGGTGGGQMLRIALAMSAISRTPITVTNIGATRPQPGLSYQHLETFKLLTNVCNASKVMGDSLRSLQISMTPATSGTGKGTTRRELVCDCGTAGSMVLMMDCALLPIALSGTTTQVKLRGGSDVAFSPPLDFVFRVSLPLLTSMGVICKVPSYQRGFYPKGGGSVTIHIEPLKEPLKPIVLERRGRVISVDGVVYSSGPAHEKAAEEVAKHTRAFLEKSKLSVEATITHKRLSRAEASSDGGVLCLFANTDEGLTLSADEPLPKLRPGTSTDDGAMETIAEGVVSRLLKDIEHGGCVDEHMQDALLLPMALARGSSTLVCGPLTAHSKSAMNVLRNWNVEFIVTDLDGPQHGATRIEVKGLGVEPQAAS